MATPEVGVAILVFRFFCFWHDKDTYQERNAANDCIGKEPNPEALQNNTDCNPKHQTSDYRDSKSIFWHVSPLQNELLPCSHLYLNTQKKQPGKLPRATQPIQ
jgi:hypothetical protein